MDSAEGYLPLPPKFSTIAIHEGQEPEKWDSMCVVPPIVLSTTFKQCNPGKNDKYKYARAGNPSRGILEECLAALEAAPYAITYSSCVAATSNILAMLKSGDHIICCDEFYHGTRTVFDKIGGSFNVSTSFVDATDVNNVEPAITPNTKIMWIETPSNPLLKISDISAIAAITRKHNVLLVVDNTFLTSYFQRPLDLGADVSIYSLTKYINGHSDAMMGAIVTKNQGIYEKLKFLQEAMGSVPCPFTCTLVTRSLKTLALRLRQHNRNSLAVAKYMESHPKISRVLHPGLPSHPQHKLFKRQTSGNSGMMAVYLKGGLDETKKFLASVKVFKVCESLGGYDSTIKFPYLMDQGGLTQKEMIALDITESMLRLSVGLEDESDLIDDLKQALNCV